MLARLRTLIGRLGVHTVRLPSVVGLLDELLWALCQTPVSEMRSAAAALPPVAFHLEARLDSERAWAGLGWAVSNSSPKRQGWGENRRSPLRVRDVRLGR